MAQALYPVVGVDIGKDTMHIVALDQSGAIAHKQRCTRATVLTRLLQLDADLIAMEACPGAHHLGIRVRSCLLPFIPTPPTFTWPAPCR